MDKDMNLVAEKARCTITARRAILGAAILVMASQTALADTTTLICDTGLPLDMGPTTIELNAAQSKVTLHLPALKNSSIPARTSGPLLARFGRDEINFSRTDGGVRHTYVLNRLTGVVQDTAVNLGGGPGFNEFLGLPCWQEAVLNVLSAAIVAIGPLRHFAATQPIGRFRSEADNSASCAYKTGFMSTRPK